MNFLILRSVSKITSCLLFETSKLRILISKCVFYKSFSWIFVCKWRSLVWFWTLRLVYYLLANECVLILLANVCVLILLANMCVLTLLANDDLMQVSLANMCAQDLRAQKLRILISCLCFNFACKFVWIKLPYNSSIGSTNIQL